MALRVLLRFESEVVEDGALGGFVGMSGWLPCRKALEEIIKPPYEHPDSNDPFERDNKDSSLDNLSVGVRVMVFVRDNMDPPPITTALPACLQTPVFLGHGEVDGKVSVKLGREAASTLAGVGVDITWQAYAKLGH